MIAIKRTFSYLKELPELIDLIGMLRKNKIQIMLK